MLLAEAADASTSTPAQTTVMLQAAIFRRLASFPISTHQNRARLVYKDYIWKKMQQQKSIAHKINRKDNTSIEAYIGYTFLSMTTGPKIFKIFAANIHNIITEFWRD